jgi:signal transduction histidine kinase
MARSRIVAPIAYPSWSGPRAGVPYRAQLTAINRRPVTSVGEALREATRAGVGNILHYTFAIGGRTVEVPVEVMRFTFTDYLGLFGNYLVNGVAFLLTGFGVVMLRPRLPAARAMFLFCLSWGLVMITSLEDFATFRFRELMAVAHAAAPSSLLYLALRFPAEHRWARRRSAVWLLLGAAVVLAALDITLYDRAPHVWMRFFDLTVIWITVAVLLAVAMMWGQYRWAASAIAREKIKIVLLGAVVAFAFPSAAALGGYLLGAPVEYNFLFAITWLFPAALAYAIVQRDLFEIDVLLRRAALYVALTAIVFAAYVAMLALFSGVFHDLGFTRSPWFTLLFTLAVLAIVRPLRGWVQAGVDQLFFRTRFDYVEITESLGQALTRTLDSDEITRHLRQALTATMAPISAVLFERSVERERFRCLHAGVPPLTLPSPVVDSLAAGRIVSAPDAPGLSLDPPAALLVPLCFEASLEGLLVLGPKKSGAAYGPRDLELLRNIAKQAATALRNAASYRQVTGLLNSLETRVEERTRELQETQAELQESNQKLRELDRLKTEFFSEASHELRTPLTLVLGPLAQLCQQASRWPVEARRLLDLAHSNSAKLLVLTDTLLDLSRLDAGRMQPVCRAEPLAPLIERTIEPFRWLAQERGVELRWSAPAAALGAWCDAAMVSKILGNLLANALKFTTSGYIEVGMAAAGQRVGIRVSDTGPGIPAHELPHIFERYRQASTAAGSSFSGSGLGLALVRELTELHRGTVEVSSESGKGTTFVVWLPAAEPDATTRDEIPSAHLYALAAAKQDATAGGEAVRVREDDTAPSVLVVDDNAGVLQFVSGLLSPEYRVRTAPDAHAALERVQAERPDIILCDVMMPGPDGVAFCQMLKRDPLLRHIPLILLTARASLTSKLSGLEAGADDYITKPFHPEELMARMRALLRMRQMERELSEAYTRLRDAQAQLVQAEKMASLGTLVAGVAHEINNPVSFINSSIDLISTSVSELREVLDRHLDAPAQSQEIAALREELDYQYRIAMLEQNAAICREGASRAARIVSDLRSFCRPGTGRRELTDLHESLDQSLRLLQGEYRGRIAVHRSYGRIPPVMCDKGQISQVFLNLLANAMQAIEGSGEVTIRTQAQNGSVTVEIEDSGHGMDERVTSRAFDPFFTTKDVGKGTGLGLSIVRSLVTAHGGDIEVRSAVGKGSVFTVTLPAAGEES